jgi:tRNA-specific 2-thiouridylase
VNPSGTVIVAMSGGVDSSVAAALLQDRGFDVIGITLNLIDEDRKKYFRTGPLTRHVDDARKVASQLGIRHLVVNASDHFQEEVLAYFSREYEAGRTPNPCVRCNRLVKFDTLLRTADSLGAAMLATGHYARVNRGSRRCSLLRGRDPKKDQSYFLYGLTQEQLSRTLFPLGEHTKGETRERAAGLDLHVSGKPESQEICFIDGKNYRDFFAQTGSGGLMPGPIVDGSGNVLARHNGIIGYTIGQRRGLGVSSDRPLYVTGIDRVRNRIIVGDRDEVYHRGLVAGQVNWISTGEAPDRPLDVDAKIRSIHTPAPARLVPIGEDRVRLEFQEPQWAVTPGQAAVFYDGEIVLGGGIIEEIVRD